MERYSSSLALSKVLHFLLLLSSSFILQWIRWKPSNVKPRRHDQICNVTGITSTWGQMYLVWTLLILVKASAHLCPVSPSLQRKITTAMAFWAADIMAGSRANILLPYTHQFHWSHIWSERQSWHPARPKGLLISDITELPIRISLSPPVFLINSWHTSLYNFKVYSKLVWFTYIVKWVQ